MTPPRITREACFAATVATVPISAPISVPISVLISVLCLGLASPAAAQSCALLRPGVPEQGRPAADTTVRAVTDAIAGRLTNSGITVIAAADAQRRMAGQPHAECNRLDCGANVVRSLGVDFVVLITVWAPRGRPTSVVVTLIGDDDSVAGDAPVESNDVISAATSALQTAHQRWQASQMGFLIATSTPSGASVEVDGRIIGDTPLRHLVGAGERRVRVLMDGYVPSDERVVVRPTGEHTIEVALVPNEAVAPTPPETRDEPSFLNWIVGGGVAALGVGLLVSPLHGLAVDGSCVGEVPCEQVHRFGTVNGVLLGVGLAALAAGIVVMVWQPFRVGVSVDANSAGLLLEGNF